MLKKALTFFLTISLLLSLCGCFPTLENNYSTKNMTSKDKITIEELSTQAKHIELTPFKNFTVNADVKIAVKNNFNTYTAKPIDIDFERWSSLFINGEDVTRSYKDNNFINKITDDGSIAVIQTSLHRQSRFDYVSSVKNNREIDPVYSSYIGQNSYIDYQYNAPLKELDFMSSENARILVADTLNTLGLGADSFDVYSVDCEFLKKYDAFERWFMKDFETDFITRTKDDEFYIIIPKFAMPNGSLLTDISYTSPDDISICSGCVHSIVGKSGFVDFSCDGLFDITDEKTDISEIVSVDDALQALLDDYKDVEISDPLSIESIELSYIPYMVDKDKGIFELKPTWIFSLKRIHSDGYIEKINKVVDAATGTQLLQQSQSF